MAQFNLPNIQTGGSQTINANTLQDAMNQAQSAGTWNPGAGTYGANSSPGGGGGGGSVYTGGGGGGGTDLSGLAAFGAQTSGVTQAQLAQQKAEFDAQLQFAQQQMQQLGIPQLQINQFLAQLQQQQFESGLAMGQQAQAYQQAATTAGLTGYYTAPAAVPDVSQWTNSNLNLNNPLAGGAGGGGTATGTGYFIGTDGRIHVGSPSGTGQPGYGSAQGLPAASGWAPGTQSSNPSVFLQPPSQQAAAGGTAGSPGNVASGTGFFIGTDGRVHVGSPSGTGQPGWGSAQGTPAASGWAVGTESSNPNVFLQPPQAPTPATPAPAQPAAPAPAAPAQPQMTMQLGQLLGQFNGQPTEAAREFNAGLGQQYLATAAQLQGPQNTFQLSNYLRGAQANQNVPVYLQNLAQGVGQNLFNAPGQTAPTPQSAAGLAGQLGGQQSATPGWNYGQTLGTIQNIMNAGAQKLGPGALENLTPDELQALGSGIGAAGGTLPSFMQQYAQSRLGQAAPIQQTSLAG
jgi:hypothetical protein